MRLCIYGKELALEILRQVHQATQTILNGMPVFASGVRETLTFSRETTSLTKIFHRRSLPVDISYFHII